MANALYWCEEFHVDGLRVDAVASMLYLDYSREDGEWTPNRYGGRENLEAIEFLQEVNATVYKHHPDVVTVAEESTAWPGVTRPTDMGGLGFGFKWNMGWMNDTLYYSPEEPIYRQWHHHPDDLRHRLRLERELHPADQPRRGGARQGFTGRQDARRRVAAAGQHCGRCSAFMWAHPGKQLLFMGVRDRPTRSGARTGLDWARCAGPGGAGVQRLVRDLNRVYRDSPALWTRDTRPTASGGWSPTTRRATRSPSLRIGDDGAAAGVRGELRRRAARGLPGRAAGPGRWREVINTDAGEYGGSGVGNLGRVTAEAVGWHGMPFSAPLRLPPLGAIWLLPDPLW